MAREHSYSRATLSLALVLLVLFGTTQGYTAVASSTSLSKTLTPTSIGLESSPNPAVTNDLITVGGQLISGRRPLGNQVVEVQFSTDLSTWTTIASPLTDSDGRFSTGWQPASAAQFYLRARFAGNKQYSASSSSVIVENVNGPVASPGFVRVGVNYLSLYHLYETPRDVLKRDFARFKNDGINTIVIVMYWYRLESSKGVYNQQFINNVIRVCNVAELYGLEVMIDFHTLIQDSDAWSNPSYVGVGMSLITDTTIADSYVAMVNWTVNQLRGVPNIWSYAVLNEPWYWPLDDWRKTNWINLVIELSHVVRQTTGRPVTVRFVGALFERDWGWDSRMIGALDFISLNAYVSESTTDNVYWNNFKEYADGLRNVAQKAAGLGKPVQITEFGSDVSDENLQADKYRAYTDIFRTTTNVIGWLCWGWDRGHDPNNTAWTAIGAFSVIDQASETVRLAYSILVQSK